MNLLSILDCYDLCMFISAVSIGDHCVSDGILHAYSTAESIRMQLVCTATLNIENRNNPIQYYNCWILIESKIKDASLKSLILLCQYFFCKDFERDKN